MTFTYPAVFMPRNEGNGYHVEFPDLEGCWGEGPDLEDAIEDAKEAAYNWLMVELEEQGGGHFPARSHVDDIELEDGCFVRELMIIIKLMPDSD